MTGLDTETHLGKAVLICTPTEETTFPHSFAECLEFLIGTGETKFCCWNGDYDIAAMLKFLEPGVLERLYKMEKWTFHARLCGPQERAITLHYIPRKFLRIRVGSAKKKRFWSAEIYDMAQFYNCSLEFAAQQELGESKGDPGVAWDKLKTTLARGGPKAKKIVEYCKRDASLVERLYHKTKDKFAQINVPFEKPISCASLSYHVFKAELTERRIRVEYNEMARESFRGGMIECLRAGYFAKAYYIDLRSAYPSAIRQLVTVPSHWLPIRPGKEPDPMAQYASVDCAVNIPLTTYKSPIPYTPCGLMTMYSAGRWRLWLDLHSFYEAKKLGYIWEVYGGVQGLGVDNRRPFEEKVEALYLERAKDPMKKWAVKIILNSLYGKMAETKRIRIALDLEKLADIEHLKLAFEGREEFRPHTNFFMAGEVTSKVRWRLFHELDHRQVIFYATDGVFLLEKPKGLDFGDALGQWSPPEEVRDLVVVGSGVYTYKYLSKTGEWKTTTRFRGFNSSLDLYRILDKKRHEIPIELQRNQKLGMTIVRQAWDMFNVIHMEERTLHVNFDRKRIWEKKWTARELLERSFTSKPWLMLDDQYMDSKMKLPKGRLL